MYKEKVIIRNPSGDCYGKEGIVVAVNIHFSNPYSHKEHTACKVLIGNKLTNWLDCRWLEIVNKEPN